MESAMKFKSPGSPSNTPFSAQSRRRTLGFRTFLFGIIIFCSALASRGWVYSHAQAVWKSLVETRLRPCSGSSTFSTLSPVDDFLATHVPIAKAGVLANIGPNGSKASGAKSGVIIASPSTSNPNYLYTWTRDAALTTKVLVKQYTAGEDHDLRVTIDDYVSAQASLQQVENPSGNINTGGLGEPKFNIDLTAFTDPWGRPQRDGPGLRATALIGYANWLIANGNGSYASNKLWPIIKLDLDYTAIYWNQTGFDLWEEVSSSSFFTTVAHLRAMHEGAALAARLGQTSLSASYEKEASNVHCFLQSYWNPTGNYVTSNTGGGRSGLDANSLIASIHGFDADAGCDATTFQPCSDKALANHKVYVDSFRGIYSVNSGLAPNAAVATGRYPEDVYFGGNPWYLTTNAAAEQLYDALVTWNRLGSINVTEISLAFFRQFIPSINVGNYAAKSPTYKDLTSAIRDYADGFIAVAGRYTPSDGALAEQYDRTSGEPLSARDLTWSYASLLSANDARNGFAPVWGAQNLVLPSKCVGAPLRTVQIKFNVLANTTFGENIYIAGSIDQLSNWSGEKARKLSDDHYPTWSIVADIPANTRFEYKYIRKFNEKVIWESGPNHVHTSPASGTDTINDEWR